MKREINGNVLELIIGDIAKQETDVIVNAANGTLMGGAKLETGEAVITEGYNLPVAYVIHTVGPVWSGDKKEKERLLANCYRNSLQIADKKGLKLVSCPSISTGIYHFPIELAAEVALKTITDFLKNNKQLDKVTMVLFSEEDCGVYAEALDRMR